MSTSEVERLIVAAEPQGIDDVESELESVESKTEETATGMDTAAGQMTDLANRWSGAMTAILGGLTLAVSGILSRVPAVQETMDALNAVIESIALRLQGPMNGALSDVNDAFFDLAGAIAEGKGEFDALVNAVGEILNLWFRINPFTAQVILLFEELFDASFDLNSAFASVGRAINGLIGWFGMLATRVGTEVNSFVDDVVRWFRDLGSDVQDWARGFVDDVVSFFSGLAGDIDDVFVDLINDAVDWGRNIINSIVEGIRAAGPQIQDAFEGLPVVGGAIEAGGGFIDDIFGGDGGGGGGDNQPVRPRSTRQSNVYLDGRRLDAQTGRYRKDASTRRGI